MDPYSILTTRTQAQQIYAELLPILGSEFLGQFKDVSLIAFYLHCKAHNIALSMDQLINGFPQCILAQFILAILPFHFSNLKQEFFSSINIKNRVENLIYTEKIRSNFLNFYLKIVKLLLILKLRHLFKQLPTQK
jgi:hypothetical protein